MANRYSRSEFARGFVADSRFLRFTVSFGATGAPTIATGTGMGIKSITRNSAGTYTIALQDPYAGLLRMSYVFNTHGTSAAPTAPSMYIDTDSVSSATAPLVKVIFNAAGTATDPASGEKVYLELEFNNSSLTY